MKTYELTEAHFGNPAGTKVVKAKYHDYGLSNDDTRHTGVEHTSVSLKEDGDYPFFTIPVYKLREVV